VNTNVQTEVSTANAPPRLYSPAVLAAYAALTNLPIALFLLGANYRARGLRNLGISVQVFSVGALVLLGIMSLREATPRAFTYGLAVFGALGIYQTEAAPFHRALAAGAVRAKWWPPALIIVCAALVLLGMQALW
jgi:hypothetical protein